MNETTVKELQEQNQQLRNLITSLSATLLRKAASELELFRLLDRADAERLVREADECFRCARLPRLKSEIAQGLDAAGHELMALAVEIEAQLQRAKRKS